MSRFMKDIQWFSPNLQLVCATRQFCRQTLSGEPILSKDLRLTFMFHTFSTLFPFYFKKFARNILTAQV